MRLHRYLDPDTGEARFAELDENGYATRHLRTHEETADCHEHGCVAHSPTPVSASNPLGDAPYNWRGDRYPPIMERICPHGIGHPDVDQANYNTRNGLEYENIHGCDGCCVSD